MEEKEFINSLKEALLEAIVGRGLNISVGCNIVGTDSELCLLLENGKIAIPVDIADIYAEYMFGTDIKGGMQEFLSMVETEFLNQVDISQFLSQDNISANVRPMVVKSDWNPLLLSTHAHRPINGTDLSVVYYCDFTVSEYLNVIIRITNDLLDSIHMKEDALYQLAIENMESDSWKIQSVGKFIDDIFADNIFTIIPPSDKSKEAESPEKEPSLSIISNRANRNGAACLLSPKILDRARKLLGCDFYIIPSNIHEILILDPADCSAEELRDHIREVNSTKIAPYMVLSDRVYGYTKEKGLYMVPHIPGCMKEVS